MRISEQRLREIWCQLNRYQVPKEFVGQLNEDAWDLPKCLGMMAVIEALIGKSACLEEWNKP